MTDESDLSGATPRRRPKKDVLEIGGRRLQPSTLIREGEPHSLMMKNKGGEATNSTIK